MQRVDVVEAGLWKAIVEEVIRDDHLKRAQNESESASEEASHPGVELSRLDAKLKQTIRAEEVILERFGRGLITEPALDKELHRLSEEIGDA